MTHEIKSWAYMIDTDSLSRSLFLSVSVSSRQGNMMRRSIGKDTSVGHIFSPVDVSQLAACPPCSNHHFFCPFEVLPPHIPGGLSRLVCHGE